MNKVNIDKKEYLPKGLKIKPRYAKCLLPGDNWET